MGKWDVNGGLKLVGGWVHMMDGCMDVVPDGSSVGLVPDGLAVECCLT